jgi:hypothetical protein
MTTEASKEMDQFYVTKEREKWERQIAELEVCRYTIAQLYYNDKISKAVNSNIDWFIGRKTDELKNYIWDLGKE